MLIYIYPHLFHFRRFHPSEPTSPYHPESCHKNSKQLIVMYVKVKSTMFIDTLQFELTEGPHAYLKAVLKDDKGSVCSTLDTVLPSEQRIFTWRGLNDLPYGVYTLEMLEGGDNLKTRLVKRI